MLFVAIVSVPGQLTEGSVYNGQLVVEALSRLRDPLTGKSEPLTLCYVIVFDDSRRWRCFEADMFCPPSAYP